jgi:hypothetical protein
MSGESGKWEQLQPGFGLRRWTVGGDGVEKRLAIKLVGIEKL